jgi:hypothetical protein
MASRAFTNPQYKVCKEEECSKIFFGIFMLCVLQFETRSLISKYGLAFRLWDFNDMCSLVSDLSRTLDMYFTAKKDINYYDG